MVNTRSTLATYAAAKTNAFLSPLGVGTTMTRFFTPATFAGIAFIKTEEGYDAFPPGTYNPTESKAVIF